MAGTRLAIHATFVVELLALVALSFLYASTRRNDPLYSAEPFLADKTGWRILAEDVSPAPSGDGGGILDYAMGCAAAAMSQIDSLLGAEPVRVAPDRPRRASAFVRELRRKVEWIPAFEDGGEGGKAGVLPPMKVNLVVPQAGFSSSVGKSLAKAIERGVRSQLAHKASIAIRVGMTKSRFAKSTSSSCFDVSDNDLCDHFQLPIKSKPDGNHRELRFPEIVVLMGCSSSTIPDERLSRVEVEGDIVIVRTVLTAHQKNELLSHLEEEVSCMLSTLFAPLSNSGDRVESVSIRLIDENPASHVAEGAARGITAKDHFDILGKALSSSVQSTIGPLLEDLSFIHGVEIEVNDGVSGIYHGNVAKAKDSISLAVDLSAYLALPEDIFKLELDDEETSSVSSDGLAKWAHAHFRHQSKRTGDVEWILFVPSQDKIPLAVEDKSNGGQGKSIILSPPHLDGKKKKNPHLNGISLVNITSFAGQVDADQIYSGYRDDISQSLMYLVGYIRAIHGLSPSVIQTGASPSSMEYHGLGDGKLSFWELESISQGHFYSSLEEALDKTDALMSLLHQHAGTLALPREVAHKVNNATQLLRQSISLVEKGFPSTYATSLVRGSLIYLQSVQNDHRLVELPYFALDHYLAVFSPLVLPLMLPMIMGLIREVKRFRELRKRKDKC